VEDLANPWIINTVPHGSNTCPLGQVKSAFSCDKCSSGEYSAFNRTTCTSCQLNSGTIRSGSSSCMKCQGDSIASSLGRCTKCPPNQPKRSESTESCEERKCNRNDSILIGLSYYSVITLNETIHADDATGICKSFFGSYSHLAQLSESFLIRSVLESNRKFDHAWVGVHRSFRNTPFTWTRTLNMVQDLLWDTLQTFDYSPSNCAFLSSSSSKLKWIPCKNSKFVRSMICETQEICPLKCKSSEFIDGNEACKKCPQNTKTTGREYACSYSCPPGSFSNESLCTLCGAGSFSNSYNVMTCMPCAPGFYSDKIGPSSCERCQSGKFSNSNSSSSCRFCPIGTIDNEDMSGCRNCSAGKFRSWNQASACWDCDADEYSPAGSTTCYRCSGFGYGPVNNSKCALCPPGKFSIRFEDDQSRSKCQLCPSGRISMSFNSTSCFKCINLDSNSDGTQCIACPPGKYLDIYSSSCSECNNGTYSNQEGTRACKVCDIGKFTLYSGSSFCYDCHKGSTYVISPSVSNSEYDTQCVPCLAGTYNDGSNGKAECISCPAGKVSYANSSTCLDCSPGYSALNSRECSLCVRGTFNDGSFAECRLCEKGKYNSDSGSSFCKSCPENSFSSEGSEKLQACVCKPDFYGTITADSSSCVKCPMLDGVYCPGNTSIPKVLKGYFRDPLNSSNAYRRIPPSACIEFDELNTSCADLYTGLRCGNCIKLISFRRNNECKSCPSESMRIFFIALFVIIFTFVSWKLSSSIKSIPMEIRLSFQSLQIIALYPSFISNWPDNVKGIFNAISFSVCVFFRLFF
jgi:hypothetical protein